MKKNLVPILFAVGITALSGCANNAENTRNNIRTTNVRDSVRNNVDFRDNNRLTVSERAARNVQCLTEVDRANVIIRGNIAYVTVRLSDYTGRGSGNFGTGNNGTNGTNGSNSANIGNTGINVGNGLTGTRGNNNGDTVFEQHVANQVSNADQNVKKVYISSDANLFKQMSTYSNDIHNGKNRNGFLRNFTDTTRAFFINR